MPAFMYVAQCPWCQKCVEVLADAGTAQDKPEMPFVSPCPHCHLEIKFRSDMLRPVVR